MTRSPIGSEQQVKRRAIGSQQEDEGRTMAGRGEVNGQTRGWHGEDEGGQGEDTGSARGRAEEGAHRMKCSRGGAKEGVGGRGEWRKQDGGILDVCPLLSQRKNDKNLKNKSNIFQFSPTFSQIQAGPGASPRTPLISMNRFVHISILT